MNAPTAGRLHFLRTPEIRARQARRKLCLADGGAHNWPMVPPARALLPTGPGPMRPRRNQEGYTLFELMVVVLIIGILAGLAVPSVTSAMRERRKTRAAHDVVRVFQVARQASIASGAAHLLRLNEGDNGGRGSINVFRGDTNRCNTSAWDTTVQVSSGCEGNLRCLRQGNWNPYLFEPTGSNYTIDLDLTNNGLGTTIDVCYEGNGVMTWRNGTTGFFSDNPVLADGSTPNGAFRINVSALVNSADPGVVRRVFVPFGGEARFVQ